MPSVTLQHRQHSGAQAMLKYQLKSTKRTSVQKELKYDSEAGGAREMKSNQSRGAGMKQAALPFVSRLCTIPALPASPSIPPTPQGSLASYPSNTTLLASCTRLTVSETPTTAAILPPCIQYSIYAILIFGKNDS